MLTILLSAALGAGMLQVGAQAGGLMVDLQCRGAGDASHTQNVAVATPGQPKPEPKFRTQRETFRGLVRVRVRGTTADVLLPPEMMRNNPGRSWVPIKKFVVSDGEIAGKVDLGLLYAPLINVNRSTGDLSIRGSISNFTGACEPYDPTVRRF